MLKILVIALILVTTGYAQESDETAPPEPSAETSPVSTDVAADPPPVRLSGTDTEAAPRAGAAPVPRPCQQRRHASYRPPPVRPAPAASAAKIRELVAKYGLIDIRGSLATVAELQRMDRAFATLPRSCFQRLRISIERDNSGEDETGYWCPIDASGANIGEDDDPEDAAPPFAGGHIYYFGPRVTNWIYVHEVAHHVTILQDPATGQAMLDALGYRLTATTTSTDFSRRFQFATRWTPKPPPRSTTPTPYCTRHPQEHLADLVAWQFAYGDREYDAQYIREFRMPPTIRQLIRGAFGNGGEPGLVE